MKLVWSSKFTRAARNLARRKPDALDSLETALKWLEIDPYDPRLRSHPLAGDLKGSWACAAGYDLRLVFEFATRQPSGEKEIHLVNIGTHDEVY